MWLLPHTKAINRMIAAVNLNVKALCPVCCDLIHAIMQANGCTPLPQASHMHNWLTIEGLIHALYTPRESISWKHNASTSLQKRFILPPISQPFAATL